MHHTPGGSRVDPTCRSAGTRPAATLTGALAFAAALAASAGPVAADQATYVGPDGGNWNNPAHWSTGRVPSAGDWVRIFAPDTTVRLDRDYVGERLVDVWLAGNNNTRLVQESHGMRAGLIDLRRGTYEQSGGTVDVFSGFVVRGGTYRLSGGSLNAVAGPTFGGIGVESTDVITHGAVVQTGDSRVAARYLEISYANRSMGSYVLGGGSVTVDDLTIGHFGDGTFTQTGGTVRVGRTVSMAHTATGRATYRLERGRLETATERAGVSGQLSFVQTGGEHVSEAIELGAAVSPPGRAEYDLRAGTLDVGRFTNRGTFRQSGGTFRGTFDNTRAGVMELGGTAVLAGRVNNAGLVTSLGSVRVDGPYDEQGTFRSRGGEARFGSAAVGAAGYWVADPGARFLIDTDLRVGSTRAGDWDTAGASLAFTAAGTSRSTLGVAGADLGARYAGYEDNFSWGELELPAVLALTLEDGNDEAGGALYVRTLRLAGGEAQVASIAGNGLNVYYDPAAPGNDYLAGRTFTLVNGGSIIPVPEPSALGWLVALGSIPFVRRGRR